MTRLLTLIRRIVGRVRTMKTNAIVSLGTMLIPISIFLMTLAVVIDPYKGFNQLALMPLFWCGVAFGVIGFFCLREGFKRAVTDDKNKDKQYNDLHNDLKNLNNNLSNFVNEMRQDRNERKRK